MESSINKDWIKFAANIKADTLFIPATAYKYDNVFQIKTTNEKIELTWADQPEQGKRPHVNIKSVLFFHIQNEIVSTLKIYIKDFLSNLLTIFNFSKVKTDDLDIDNKYIFISSDKILIQKLLADFKIFYTQNKFKDFIIYTEKIEKENFLIIQVNDLLLEENDLKLYFELGKSISKKF